MRRNNSEMMDSAKFHITKLFYARSHPHYQRIMIYDEIQRIFMPDSVREEWEKHSSITLSGDHSRGQDFDFILEKINRDIKQLLPTDTSPRDECWINVCRNKDLMKDLLRSLEFELGLQSSSQTKNLNLKNAICVFRLKLRQYLQSSGATLESMNGTPLHHNLPNIRKVCRAKKAATLKKVVLEDNDNLPESLSHPVYINDTEYEKFNAVRNLSKAQLVLRTKSIIEMLPQGLKPVYQKQLDENKSKGRNKQRYLQLYEEVDNVMHNVPE